MTALRLRRGYFTDGDSEVQRLLVTCQDHTGKEEVAKLGFELVLEGLQGPQESSTWEGW